MSLWCAAQRRSLAGLDPATGVNFDQRAREKAAVFDHISDNVAALFTELANRGVRLGVISNC